MNLELSKDELEQLLNLMAFCLRSKKAQEYITEDLAYKLNNYLFESLKNQA